MQRCGNAVSGIDEIECESSFYIASALWPTALTTATTASTTAKHLAKKITHVAAGIETESTLATRATAAKTHRACSTYFVVFFAFLFVT
jgi:hypothetical protein